MMQFKVIIVNKIQFQIGKNTFQQYLQQFSPPNQMRPYSKKAEGLKQTSS